MSKTLQWVIGVSVILIMATVVLSTLWPLFAPNIGWAGYGMMGPGHMYGGGNMMGGFWMPFFGILMLLGPLLFVGLIMLGGVWLVRNMGTLFTPQPPAAAVCANCGKPLQAGWKVCPYCGEKI